MNYLEYLLLLVLIVYVAYLATLKFKTDELKRKEEGKENENSDIVCCNGMYFHCSSISNYTINYNGTINIVLCNGATINTGYTKIDDLLYDIFGDIKVRYILK